MPANISPVNAIKTEETETTDFSFILLSETIKGAKLTFTRTWFKCLHCEYRSRMKRCLLKHMHENHEDMFAAVHDNMIVREEENYAINNQKVGEQHSRLMRMSAYDRLFPIMGHKRKRRLEKQDTLGVFPCTHCGKVFSRLRYLRKHSKQHSLQQSKYGQEKRFSCEQCGKTFKFKNYLRAHMNSHQVKMFQCNECDFKSNINAAIHAHRQVHNQGSVLCEVCGYAYSDKSTLSKHMRVHDMTRPYACTFHDCTWRFKSEVMCRAHVRAHTTEGKFRCGLCGYVFRHKHHLQRHAAKMHKLKLNGAEAMCSPQPIDKLLTPTQPSPTEPSFECKICHSNFEQQQILDEHLNKYHNFELSTSEISVFGSNELPETDDSKLVVTTLAPDDFVHPAADENGDQAVYVAIDQSALVQFEANALDVSNTLYVQERQPVQGTSEDDDDKTYFVSVL